ncbi:MAG: hypothetical protein GY833_12605 [Aestuariibacter sp.]|nr:hypothetical protein [Aestuariibacter sp.]|tara:strand:+ start:114035 stop:115075 length:1041 start_codon:yes stop_codon:yes gene_type:complete
MANNFVVSVAKALKLDVDHVETYWKKSLAIAAKNGKNAENSNFYAYVTGIFKRLLADDEDAKLTKEGKLALPRAEALLERYRHLESLNLDEESAMQKKLKANQQRKEKQAADGTLPKPKPKKEKPKPDTKEKPEPEQDEKPKVTPSKAAVGKALGDNKDKFNLPPDASDAEKTLARDLAELYKEMLLRWEAFSDSASINLDGEEDVMEMTWHEDNPYGKLPAVVREVLQAGAAMHYESLQDVSNIARQAMMSWQATHPTLIEDMQALADLPTLHRRALLPLMQELVRQGNMPESILELVKKNTASGTADWLNVFPTLLTSNAEQSPSFDESVCVAVTDTLVECLLS